MSSEPKEDAGRDRLENPDRLERPEMIRLDAPERSRTYVYPESTLTVENVVAFGHLHGGAHLLETTSGKKMIIVPGFLGIEIDDRVIPDEGNDDPLVEIDDEARRQAIEAIVAERQRQLSLDFGGQPATAFDEDNTLNDWVAYAVTYLGRATTAARNEKEKQDATANLVKAGAIILAALEARAKGHC